MIKNELDYLNEYYSQMKEQDLYIEHFSPHKITLSNGVVLKSGPNDEFDRDIVEDILDYNRRTRSE